MCDWVRDHNLCTQLQASSGIILQQKELLQDSHVHSKAQSTGLPYCNIKINGVGDALNKSIFILVRFV